MGLHILDVVVHQGHTQQQGDIFPRHYAGELRVERLEVVVGGGIRCQDVFGFVLTHLGLDDKVRSLLPPCGPVLGSWEFGLDRCYHLVRRRHPTLCFLRGFLPLEGQLLEFSSFVGVCVHMHTHTMNGLRIVKAAALAVFHHKLFAKPTRSIQEIGVTVVARVLVDLS